MKILVISQYFYPENFRINQLCLDLKQRGHDITVLTGKPNYPKGEYFEGYTFKGNEDEVWNGIRIIRVPLRARKTGAINLVKNYLSFVYHANKRVKSINEKFDIIYVFEVSPVTVALPAIKLKKRMNIPVIMNVQDLWPENIIAVTGINNKIIIGLIDQLVNYIYKHCDKILTASPSFVEKIQYRVKDKEKVVYWPQYSVVSKVEDDECLFDSSKFNITFTGNIGEAQGIDIAIEAAKILKDTNIHWNFIGEGRDRKRLEELCKSYDLNDNVTFHGYMEEKYIPKYLNSSDAALLILKPNPVFEMTIPAKLQTYLSCGVPILGCVSGEGKRIILEADCGVVSDEISVNSLVEVCRKMIEFDEERIQSFKDSSIRYGLNHFDKNRILDRLEYYMEELKK